jgi:hypothetical protein
LLTNANGGFSLCNRYGLCRKCRHGNLDICNT